MACGSQHRSADLIPVAKSLREEFEATTSDLDATGEYPARNMERIVESGLDAICFPREWAALRARIRMRISRPCRRSLRS
jgi:hypothetical protein